MQRYYLWQRWLSLPKIAVFVLNLSDIIFLQTAPHISQMAAAASHKQLVARWACLDRLHQWSVTLSALWLAENQRIRLHFVNMRPGRLLDWMPPFQILVLNSGEWWSLVLNIHCLRRYNMTSFSRLQTNVFAKFVDTTCIFRNAGAAAGGAVKEFRAMETYK